MHQTTQVVVTSTVDDSSACQAKRQRIGGPSTSSANPFPVALPLNVRSISVCSTFPDDIDKRWEDLAETEYVDGGRIDANDRGFDSTACSHFFMRDDDGNRLAVQCNSQGEALPIMSVFAYYAQYPDRLDAQHFRYGFRFNGHKFKVRAGSDLRLTCARGLVTTVDALGRTRRHCLSIFVSADR